MVDKEPYVVAAVKQAVLSYGATYASAFTLEKPALPKVTIVEIGNTTATRYRSTADKEDISVLTYEVNVYSMDKLECRILARLASEAMDGMNFIRDMGQFIPNLADRNIFRFVGRYRVHMNQDGVMYRPTY